MKKKIVVLLLLWISLWGCRESDAPALEKPLIGITTAYKEEYHTNVVSVNYIDAVLNSGGIPLVLPTIRSEEAIRRYVRELDGLVLIGGRDIPPEIYGQKPHETVAVLPELRTVFDRTLIAQWMASKKPVLGVCLGMQFTNVVMGGTLIQDIPAQIGTEVVHRETYHPVDLDAHSELARILGSETAMVYSNHHQAVDRIGEGLRPVAHARDGMVEALERTDGGLGLFVQWHPEVMADKYPEHVQAVYGFLVQLCVKGRL